MPFVKNLLEELWKLSVSQPGHIPVDSIDSSGPGSGRFKVLCGGSGHDEQPAALRCAARNFDDPRKRNYYYGFRIAMDI